MEMKGEEGEWESIWGGESVHYRPDNGEPIPSRMEQYHVSDRKQSSQFSTFLGAPHHAPHPLSLNNANKRSSYAPPATHTTHGPQSSDFLFGAPRFQERYRSNSMDSILVQDMNRHVFQQPQPEKMSRDGRYSNVMPGPVMMPAPGHHPLQSLASLEKRPTFDNIDKRASWSTDKYPGHYPPAHGHYPPGPVLMASVPSTLPHNLPHHQSKKPIPLPRSKIPVATKSATIERSGAQPEMRTFKRSKTDLSLNMLSNYKAGRGMNKQNSVNNFIKASSNPPPTKQKSAQLRSRPSNRSNRPAVITEELPRSLVSDDNKQSDSLVINEKHLFNKFKMSKVSNNNRRSSKEDKLSSPGVVASTKPAIKEKPSIKQSQHVNHSNKTAAAMIDKKSSSAGLISRHRSESDLLRIDADSSRTLVPDNFIHHQPFIKRMESLENSTGSDLKISLKVENSTKVEAPGQLKRSTENLIKSVSVDSNETENLNTINNSDVATQALNKNEFMSQTQALSNIQSAKNIRKVTNEKFLDEDTLPEPPPTPPEVKKVLDDEVSAASKPLIISTEPMSVSSCSNNKSVSEDKSACSSYDSFEGSLDSAWPEGGDWLGTEPSRDQVKSPNSSTCSRSPPTPPPHTCPVRHVMTDWDEFLDVSGRKYYYNSKTGEKSWKPPRKQPRSSSDGYSAPTSPDPCADQSFEMISEFEQSHDNSNQALDEDKNEEEAAVSQQNGEDSTVLENSDTVKQETLDNKVQNVSTDGSVGALDNVEEIPSGYEVKYDDGEMYYVNVFTGVSWYTARDKYGRIYYYEENGNESCWVLPSVSQTIQDHSVNPSPVPDRDIDKHSSGPVKREEEPSTLTKLFKSSL